MEAKDNTFNDLMIGNSIVKSKSTFMKWIGRWFYVTLSTGKTIELSDFHVSNYSETEMKLGGIDENLVNIYDFYGKKIKKVYTDCYEKLFIYKIIAEDGTYIQLYSTKNVYGKFDVVTKIRIPCIGTSGRVCFYQDILTKEMTDS